MVKYIALLRGVNVGVSKRIDMKRLREICEASGLLNVSTYINSGNIIFESEKKPDAIRKEIEENLLHEFNCTIPTIVNPVSRMRQIIKNIPLDWENNQHQRTDVAYLFEEIDSEKTIGLIPFNRDYIDVRYTGGAIYWNIARENYNKSRLNRLISHELYQHMTIRNINTARYLAGQ